MRHLCLSLALPHTTREWKLKPQQQGSRKGKNILSKTICLSVFALFLSVFLHLSVFLCQSASVFPFLLTSSNNTGIKLHYTPLYWSFGTIQDCLFCLPKEKWLMTHGVLIKLFLFGQIVLTMCPLNSIIAHTGAFNSFLIMLSAFKRHVCIMLHCVISDTGHLCAHAYYIIISVCSFHMKGGQYSSRNLRKRDRFVCGYTSHVIFNTDLS